MRPLAPVSLPSRLATHFVKPAATLVKLNLEPWILGEPFNGECLMKRVFKTLIAIVAAVAALTACKKELTESLERPQTISFSAEEVEPMVDYYAPTGEETTEEIETRTVFGTKSGNNYPVLWTATTNAYVMCEWSTDHESRMYSVKPSSDGKTAKLEGKNMTLSGAKNLYFFFMSGSQSGVAYSTAETTASFRIPTEQTPLDGSPDERAMILGAKTSTYSTPPTTVKFSPKHMTAYILLTPTNISSIGTLQSVTVTSTKPLSGKVTCNISAATPVLASASDGASYSVTATTSKTSNIWLACLPAQVAGTKLTIKAVGGSGTLTREITVPSGKNFVAGKIAQISVDMKPTVHVTGVSVSPTTLTLEAGKTATLTATVTPSDASDKSVSWSSSNTAVATVTSSGVVKGVKAGSATITVTTTDGGKKATCAVTVKKTATKVEILNKNSGVDPLYDDGYIHITKTQPAVIQYRITYSDGSTEDNSGGTVSISSGNGFGLTPPRQINAQTVGNTATVKVTSNNTPTVSATISLKSWDDPTSVEWYITVPKASGAYWFKTGTIYTVGGTVYPSTARQKIVLEARENTSYWDLTRRTEGSYSVKAPTFSASSYSDYINKMSILRLSAWHKSSVYSDYSFNVTNIDVREPKLFDVIAYNSTTSKYRIIDGGLRIRLTGDDFYCSNVSISIPSGYKAVGIVTFYTTNPNGENTYQIYNRGVSNMEVTSGIVGPDGTTLPGNRFHGFAIAMYNAAADKWSAENDDVDGNANWSRELGDDTYPSRTQLVDSQKNNGFMLTIAAHQYNVWRGSSHAIRPADRVWEYGEPGVLYQCVPFPKSNPSLTWVMRPWFVPTTKNWEDISAGGKYYNTKLMNKINAQIDKVGFGDKVFPYQTDSYWTINTQGGGTGSKNYAYIVYSEGQATRAKSGSAGVRPFMIF